MSDAERRQKFHRVPLSFQFPPGTPKEQLPWWSLPMNGQEHRAEATRQIIAKCGIRRIVETGTYLGTTTSFFAAFGLPVTTVELDADLASDAAMRLQRFPNVDVRIGDSVRVLQAFVRESFDRSVPTFFYLDAHFKQHLPLRDEARIVMKHFPKAVIMADDFNVADDADYGFGDEGRGRRLDLDYLLQGELTQFAVFYPRVRARDETGARRGCVVASANVEMISALNGVPGLRRFRTRWR